MNICWSLLNFMWEIIATDIGNKLQNFPFKELFVAAFGSGFGAWFGARIAFSLESKRQANVEYENIIKRINYNTEIQRSNITLLLKFSAGFLSKALNEYQRISVSSGLKTVNRKQIEYFLLPTASIKFTKIIITDLLFLANGNECAIPFAQGSNISLLQLENMIKSRNYLVKVLSKKFYAEDLVIDEEVLLLIKQLNQIDRTFQKVIKNYICHAVLFARKSRKEGLEILPKKYHGLIFIGFSFTGPQAKYMPSEDEIKKYDNQQVVIVPKDLK